MSKWNHAPNYRFLQCKWKKKGKSKDDFTDNKDSNNNNRCVSVTSVKTVKTKMGKGCTNVLPFDTRVDLSVNTDWMPVMLKINI